MDSATVFLGDPDSIGSVGRLNDVILEAFEILLGHRANACFIFSKQDRFAFAHYRSYGWELVRDGKRHRGGRQVHSENGPMLRCAAYLDVAASAFHDSKCGRQAEPSAAADFFGCEERLKDARLNFRRHA